MKSDSIPPQSDSIPPCRDPPADFEWNEKATSTSDKLDELLAKDLTRSSSYFILSYCPTEFIKPWLDSHCTFYACIFHDKDSKEPHFHYFVSFSNTKDPHLLLEPFRADLYTFMVENVRNRKSCLRYLVHADDGDKYQYPLSSVLSNKIESVERALYQRGKCETSENFLKELFVLNPYELALRYGRDYIKNFSKYQEFKNLLLAMDLVPQSILETDEQLIKE